MGNLLLRDREEKRREEFDQGVDQRSYGELNASGGFHMSSRAGGDDSNRALSNRSIRYGVGPESDCSREEPGNGVGEARRTC
jgi:hypothetical protein